MTCRGVRSFTFTNYPRCTASLPPRAEQDTLSTAVPVLLYAALGILAMKAARTAIDGLRVYPAW